MLYMKLNAFVNGASKFVCVSKVHMKGVPAADKEVRLSFSSPVVFGTVTLLLCEKVKKCNELLFGLRLNFSRHCFGNSLFKKNLCFYRWVIKKS